MTDRAGSRVDRHAGRDARRRRASLPRFSPLSFRRTAALAAIALLAPLSQTAAQLAPRPWLDWRTTETEHFALHYPTAYREWALALAERVEGMRAQIQHLVGYAPARRIDIVIDDPANDANGYAFTALDAPTIVLWPTPPEPRSEIGNARVWEELLATHELTHVLHLTRPSRNRFKRLLWSLSPVPLGPIATKSPRWVLEGYATYIEGRVTGSGRPNNAWRAAFIRQFAIEGKMPSYGQLSATGGWETGSFAYLVGSAYFEWLARREGDSSIVALWRRLTAVTDRSFDAAFTGVYGDSPAELYARFSAEVTADALAVERAQRLRGLTEGTLVQRLFRGTGDPAVSPDGRYVAITIRHVDAPSQLVVWKTIDEPDTLAERRRAAQRRRDPEDVPDRTFYPPAKKPVATLVPNDGAPYETPRWFGDNTRLLVTRHTPRPDGTLRPDLYVWNAQNGDLHRITRAAALRDADPSPDGRWAAAVRCEHGWCDLVRVDLENGAVRVLRAGSVLRNFYRPRVSRVTGEIVVAEQANDRWRIARVSPESGALRYADPDDGVTRYDATFAPDGRTIVTTSEAGGIANLEQIDTSGTVVARLTSTTGAAVAADVGPDSAVWFLALHSRGYDLRRVHGDGVRPGALPVVAVLTDSSSPVLPPSISRGLADSSRRPVRGATSAERPYGVGPSRLRYVPAATTGFGGSSAQLALVRSDPVGRLGISLIGSAGAAALPAGGSLTITSFAARTFLSASGWISHEAPSRQLEQAGALGLDLTRSGGALRADRAYVGSGGELNATVAALTERQRSPSSAGATRGAGIIALATTLRQRDEDTRYQEQLAVIGEAGRTASGAYLRQRAAFAFGTGTGDRPLTTVRLAYGAIGGGPGAAQERFVIGGFASPLIDSLFDARRVDAPAYPLGSAVGATFSSYRVGVPLAPFELFYAGASVDRYQHPLRSYGAELDTRVPALAALGTPAVQALTGIARAVDEPVKGEWRYYVTLVLRP